MQTEHTSPKDRKYYCIDCNFQSNMHIKSPLDTCIWTSWTREPNGMAIVISREDKTNVELLNVLYAFCVIWNVCNQASFVCSSVFRRSKNCEPRLFFISCLHRQCIWLTLYSLKLNMIIFSYKLSAQKSRTAHHKYNCIVNFTKGIRVLANWECDGGSAR